MLDCWHLCTDVCASEHNLFLKKYWLCDHTLSCKQNCHYFLQFNQKSTRSWLFFYKPCHRLYKIVPHNFVQSECWLLASRVQVSHRNWELLIFCQIIDLFNESRSLCTSAFSFERLKAKISAPRKLASIRGKVWFTLFKSPWWNSRSTFHRLPYSRVGTALVRRWV